MRMLHALSAMLLLAVAAAPAPGKTTISPDPTLWRTAVPGIPGPAAPGWPRTSITIRDSSGDTEYRWGLIPRGLMHAGAFLDATAWRTAARAVRSNDGARAGSAHGDGGTIVPELPMHAPIAPAEWLRGYVTPTHCTLTGGETYLNLQFTATIFSDHAPRACEPEQAWLEGALRLLWQRANGYAHARHP